MGKYVENDPAKNETIVKTATEAINTEENQTQKKKKKILLIVALIVFLIIAALVIVFIAGNVNAHYELLTEENEDGTYTVTGIDYRSGIFGDDESILRIPAEINGKKVTAVNFQGTFYQFTDTIKTVIVPEGVTTIGEGCFTPYDIQEITLPRSVTLIGNGFVGCGAKLNFDGNDYYEFKGQCLIDKQTNTIINGFNGAVIPEDVTVIGVNAFVGYSEPGNLDFSHIKTIENSAFYGCGAGEIDLSHVTYIGDSAFASSNITSVKLAAGASIGESAFAESKLSVLHFCGALSAWGLDAFSRCSIPDVYFDGDMIQFQASFDLNKFNGLVVHCTDGDITL